MKKFLSLITLVSATLSAAASADYANDRAEIENISNKYMVAVDAGDIELVMSTWHEDGELVWVFGTENGKDEIRAAMSNFGGARYQAIPEGATSRPRTRHQIINHVIDVDGDTATTTAYWFATTNNTPQGDVQLLYMGHYEDILVREDGKWLFKSRKVFNESRDNRSLWYPELGEIDPRTRMPPPN
jgi:ketosteroid isomerase-like protein